MKSFFEEDIETLHPEDDPSCCDVHFPKEGETRDAFLEKNKSEDNNMSEQTAFQKYSHTAKLNEEAKEEPKSISPKNFEEFEKALKQPGKFKFVIGGNKKETAPNSPKKEGVVFNTSILKSVLEDVSDSQAAHIDTMMQNADLLDKFDNICPVSGVVFDCMKAACADPQNLKIACSPTSEAYIEAQELLNFCEANGGINLHDAVEMIAESCIPGLTCGKTHVVFPSECADSAIIGVNNLGLATGKSWSAKMINGCLRYGLVPHIGVEVANENAQDPGDEGGDENQPKSLKDTSNPGKPVSLKDVSNFTN